MFGETKIVLLIIVGALSGGDAELDTSLKFETMKKCSLERARIYADMKKSLNLNG